MTEDSALMLVGAVDAAGSDAIGTRANPFDDASPIVQNADGIDVLADVVIDFSTAHAVESAIECARRADAALLVGTTALAASTVDALRDESTRRAVLVAPNTALGVSAMVRIVSEASRLLGGAFGCSVVEAHHAGKRDAPSGTAIRLQDAINDAGAHVKDVHAIRAGDTIGEHTVRFDGPGESIVITHRAVSRDVFVYGAMRAAAWLSTQPSGMYSIEDALQFAAR